MNQLRVLHVIPTIALEHGGPSHAVRIMASAVVQRGAEVDVAATSYGTPQGREDPNRSWTYGEDGVTYRLFPQVHGSRWNLSFPLTRWLFQNAHRYDTLHVHAPFSYPMLPACIAARRAKIPYLYRTLGTMDPWSMKQKAWKKWPYYRLLERRNLRKASAVHVTSEAERQAIEALGTSRERIALIPLGVPEVQRARSIPPEWPLRVLFIGRLHPKKGIPLLIEAIARLASEGTDVVLDIAGTGEEAYTALLVAQVHRLGLQGVVRFLGFAAGAQKERLFAETHVVALPAYDENFGISVAEAMAYGLPVVISEAVGIADHVRAAKAGRVVRTGDSAGLAAALRELAAAAERRACGERGASLVAAEFSVPVMAERLVAQYLRGTEAATLDAGVGCVRAP